MKRKEYVIIMTINNTDFGTVIIKARSEKQAYLKFIKLITKQNIYLFPNVEISFEEI